MSAEDDANAKKLVLQVLRSKPIAALAFTVDGRTIKPSMYEDVARAIEAKKITLLVDKVSGAGAGAAYFYEMKPGPKTVLYDVLTLRFSELSTTSNAARFKNLADIVHESTHAAFDILKIPNMTNLHSETAAYVAGALYQVTLFVSERGDPKKISFGNPVFARAWDIALLISQKQTVPKELINKLQTAISNDPLYKDNVKKIVPNDGVGRDWVIDGKKVKAQ
jgi:hypothetical protein